MKHSFHWGRFSAPSIGLCSVLLLGCSACREVTSDGSNPGAVEVVWRTALEARDQSADGDPGTDGKRLYFLGSGVLAFDVNTGALLWRSNRFTRSQPRNVVVQGGRVFAAEHVAFAFDAATGQELWRTSLEGTASFGNISADGQAVYVSTNSHRVYALNTADGTPLWSTDIIPEARYSTKVNCIHGRRAVEGRERLHHQRVDRGAQQAHG